MKKDIISKFISFRCANNTLLTIEGMLIFSVLNSQSLGILLDKLLKSRTSALVLLFLMAWFLFFTPYIAGMWVARWQAKPDSMYWALAGISGVFFNDFVNFMVMMVNPRNYFPGKYLLDVPAIFVIPIAYSAWLGGKKAVKLWRRGFGSGLPSSYDNKLTKIILLTMAIIFAIHIYENTAEKESFDEFNDRGIPLMNTLNSFSALLNANIEGSDDSREERDFEKYLGHTTRTLKAPKPLTRQGRLTRSYIEDSFLGVENADRYLAIYKRTNDEIHLTKASNELTQSVKLFREMQSFSNTIPPSMLEANSISEDNITIYSFVEVYDYIKGQFK